MKAIFPDPKSLQPMPSPSVHPNISGNINSTTASSTPGAPSSSTLQNTDASIPTADAKSQKTWVFYTVWCTIILCVLFLIIFLYKKLQKKERA